MKIDWKRLSKSEGYKSLKGAYIRDVSRLGRRGRSKQEYYTHFQWVIGRAKHCAQKLNRPLEDILSEWEENRDYWWLNYYQDYNQRKIHSKCLKPIGEKGIKKRRKLLGF